MTDPEAAAAAEHPPAAGAPSRSPAPPIGRSPSSRLPAALAKVDLSAGLLMMGPTAAANKPPAAGRRHTATEEPPGALSAADLGEYATQPTTVTTAAVLNPNHTANALQRCTKALGTKQTGCSGSDTVLVWTCPHPCVLCYAVLCFAVLCCALLCCAAIGPSGEAGTGHQARTSCCCCQASKHRSHSHSFWAVCWLEP